MIWAFLIGMFFVQPALAKVETVTSYKQIKHILDETLKTTDAKDVLGLWEIDYVLLTPTHPAFDPRNLKKHRCNLKEHLKPFSEAVRSHAKALAFAGPSQLMEPHIPLFIRSYQKMGITILGLTSTKIGELERERQLLAHGIALPQVICAKGFGAMAVKGKTVMDFLKGRVPPKVIFMVDARRTNLDDVEIGLKKHAPHIEFVGVLYNGTEQLPQTEISEEDFVAEWLNYLTQAKAATS